jgi:uncharacterized protein YbjT (DUF2867 family)
MCSRKMHRHGEEHVLVVGGTGRTGRRLVHRLLEDPRIAEVTTVVRSADKAQLVLGHEQEHEDRLNIVVGDLTDVGAWADKLDGVSQIVTAVSCGLSTDPAVVLGARESPSPLPADVDGDGIAQLATAAKEHGVQRFVAVTTASAGSPWSPAAIFLNLYHHGSVMEKWRGEQAIRSSGLDYVIIRPFGLGHDVPPPPGARGIEWSQGRTSGARRHIPRDDVATLCHEALLLDNGEIRRTTFECWATNEHARPMAWSELRQDPPGPLPPVDHAAAVGVASTALTVGFVGTFMLAARMRRYAFYAGQSAPDKADGRLFRLVGLGFWGAVAANSWSKATPETKDMWRQLASQRNAESAAALNEHLNKALEKK